MTVRKIFESISDDMSGSSAIALHRELLGMPRRSFGDNLEPLFIEKVAEYKRLLKEHFGTKARQKFIEFCNSNDMSIPNHAKDFYQNINL